MRFSLVLLALSAAACASRSPAPSRPAAQRPARQLAPEARKQVDQQYYEAVGAYMKADYAGARALIREILAADPGHADALALLARVKAVEKAAASPP